MVTRPQLLQIGRLGEIICTICSVQHLVWGQAPVVLGKGLRGLSWQTANKDYTEAREKYPHVISAEIPAADLYMVGWLCPE